MLSVILVDDEEIIRDGLYHGFDWKALGLKVIGLAEDGEEALKLIKEELPEIIITDIKMPFIDGLELVETGKKLNPDSYFILISGHDEFSFVQKALKLGAYDYILKPIELDYLKEIISKIILDYNARKQKEEEFNNLKAKVHDNLPLLKEHFLRELIAGNFNHHEELSKADELGFEDDKNKIAVALVQLDDYYSIAEKIGDKQREVLERTLAEIIKSACGDDVLSLINRSFEYILVFFGNNHENLLETTAKVISRIRQSVNRLKPFTLSIAVGGEHEWPHNLRLSFQEAEEVLDYKFIIGKDQDLYYRQAKNDRIKEENKLFADFDLGKILAAIKAADREGIKGFLKDLVPNLTKKGENPRIKMELLVGNIFLQAVRFLHRNGFSGEEVFNDPFAAYQKIINFQTADDMIDELQVALVKIVDYIEHSSLNRFYQNIEKAKEYIKENYGRAELNLDEVANHTHMGTSYFSFVFKQEEGVNFIEYLTRIRLEKAEELLVVSNYRAYEIAYLVGYSNPTYFSTIFKKHYGLSPSEYKRRYSNTKPEE